MNANQTLNFSVGIVPTFEEPLSNLPYLLTLSEDGHIDQYYYDLVRIPDEYGHIDAYHCDSKPAWLHVKNNQLLECGQLANFCLIRLSQQPPVQPLQPVFVKIIGFDDDSDSLLLENGYKLQTEHETECIENHWLAWGSIKDEGYEGKLFDISSFESLIEPVIDAGVRLKASDGSFFFVPGYNSNNGYYGSDLELKLLDNKDRSIWSKDISE